MLGAIKKYGIYVLLILLGVFAWFKFKKKQPTNLNEESKKILTNLGVRDLNTLEFYKSNALSLAHNLGTAYAKYDPRYWTENDNKVYNTMRQLSTSDFNYVSKLYNEVYAKGRDLSSDLRKLLDSKLYEKLVVK